MGRQLLLKTRRGELPGNPITNPAELAAKLQELCGAEGYRLDGAGQILALRWDLDGNEVVIDRFQACEVNA